MPGTEDTIGSLRQTLSAIVLPVEQTQRDRLVEIMDSELLSLTDLARELIRVPVAALHICRAAGETSKARDIDILTLEQACGLLGTQRLGNILKNMPTSDVADTPLPYRQLLSISEHAYQQAQGFFSHRMARLWHEMSLASLLFLSPCWVLIYHRPQLFEQWDARHLGNKTHDDAQDDSDGMFDSNFLLALAQQLAQDWWLPPWILQGYRSLGSSRRVMVKALHIARDASHPRDQQAALDQDKTLSRWLTQPANSPLLANGIALGAHHDWEARHTRRWQQLTALYLGSSVVEIQLTSHMNAVEIARFAAHAPGNIDLWQPAEALVWPEGSRRIRPATDVRAVAQANDVRGSRQSTLTANAAAWRQECRQLLATPSPFKSVLAILNSALQALNEGLGARQCWIALYNGKEQQLILSASAGFERQMVGMMLGPCRGNAWGNWLMKRRCHTILGHAASAPLPVPQKIRELTDNQAYHLLPLAPKGVLMGAVYVSFEQGNPLPEDRREPALTKTIDCLNRALVIFSAKH
ncbi:MAG TPA: hypothetical protein ENI17_17850 [Pseudomonas xinjiangensis]|uniref:HDOD domain-containing protein n=2 Tax=root TaxID=1 RepID=A0A7V1FSU2_9GAMM|nr:hypothetical protein [Halopseudomonas xinjiangensis]HEC49469.1 hypothetical protein [Halopseudomonas xinjiangensis]